MDAQNLPDVERIISLSSTWLKSQDDVLGIALVGSYARGAASPSSDIDLVIVCTAPQAYRTDMTWPSQLPWDALGLAIHRMHDQDYGVLWSRHVLLSAGLEVEFGFAPSAWAMYDPIDPGTLQGMRTGHRILYDRDGLLRCLSEYVLTHKSA
jgi:uncharacterized protein